MTRHFNASDESASLTKGIIASTRGCAQSTFSPRSRELRIKSAPEPSHGSRRRGRGNEKRRLHDDVFMHSRAADWRGNSRRVYSLGRVYTRGVGVEKRTSCGVHGPRIAARPCQNRYLRLDRRRRLSLFRVAHSRCYGRPSYTPSTRDSISRQGSTTRTTPGRTGRAHLPCTRESVYTIFGRRLCPARSDSLAAELLCLSSYTTQRSEALGRAPKSTERANCRKSVYTIRVSRSTRVCWAILIDENERKKKKKR